VLTISTATFKLESGNDAVTRVCTNTNKIRFTTQVCARHTANINQNSVYVTVAHQTHYKTKVCARHTAIINQHKWYALQIPSENVAVVPQTHYINMSVSVYDTRRTSINTHETPYKSLVYMWPLRIRHVTTETSYTWWVMRGISRGEIWLVTNAFTVPFS
jgi:hypothetical protein